jgi:hypothetical protein
MAMVCEWFDLKITRMVFSDLAPKLVATVFFQFGLKTGGDGFSRFNLKTDSWFLG